MILTSYYDSMILILATSSFCAVLPGLGLFRWRGLRRPLRQLEARGSEAWPGGGAQLHTLQATHHGGAASTHRPGER